MGKRDVHEQKMLLAHVLARHFPLTSLNFLRFSTIVMIGQLSTKTWKLDKSGCEYEFCNVDVSLELVAWKISFSLVDNLAIFGKFCLEWIFYFFHCKHENEQSKKINNRFYLRTMFVRSRNLFFPLDVEIYNGEIFHQIIIVFIEWSKNSNKSSKIV